MDKLKFQNEKLEKEVVELSAKVISSEIEIKESVTIKKDLKVALEKQIEINDESNLKINKLLELCRRIEQISIEKEKIQNDLVQKTNLCLQLKSELEKHVEANEYLQKLNTRLNERIDSYIKDLKEK